MNLLGRHIAQRLLFGVGFFFGMFGVLMLIGLSRSPEGFRPAPFIGLVILGAVIMVVSVRWQRQSITDRDGNVGVNCVAVGASARGHT